MSGVAADWDAAVVDLLERAKLAQSDQLAEEVNAAVRPLGVDVTVFLVDHEQRRLWALPERGKPIPPPMLLDGSLAGRAFNAVHTQRGRTDGDVYRLWVPLIDGSERLGVAEVAAHVPPADPEFFRRRAESFLGLVGHLVTVKLPYGDKLQKVRRTREMTPAGELILQMLPPLTFSCHRMSVSGVLEPAYDVGGDAFDYAVDEMIARVSVLDAMGRGLGAALASATALSAMRAARRAERGLLGMAAAADVALTEEFPDLRYVTAVLAELDMESGILRYYNAGHPAPLLIRNGRTIRSLTGGRRTPLGIPDVAAEAGTESLEPGDRLLLFTDGVTEATDATGRPFGVDRLSDLAERCMADGLPSPETLRRLTRAVLEHQGGRPTDDATLLLLEWSREAGARTQP